LHGRADDLPAKAEVLSLEELDQVASASWPWRAQLRLTGGEPLVRRGILSLVERLSRHRASGALDELTLTTNGTRLPISPPIWRAWGSSGSMSRWTP